MYTRASASDYDDFQAKGWTTKELIPLMRKHETYQRACNNRDIHGFDGPIKGVSKPKISSNFLIFSSFSSTTFSHPFFHLPHHNQ
jgi:hypothetical protein